MIRILIVDDHRILRDGLRTLLNMHSDMNVVAEAEDGRRAVLLAAEATPNVVVMDISMPGLNGIEATRQIKAANPSTKVVALSVHSQDRRLIVSMLQAGASAFLSKEESFEELALAIRIVMRGKVYLSPGVAHLVVEQIRGATSNTERSVYTLLTPREREVLQLIAEGEATKEIASKLQLSVKTIETHRRQIMEKLDLYTVAELTKYAVCEGMTSLDGGAPSK